MASIERINFRLSPAQKQMIEQAAACSGQSLTDYAIMTLCNESSEILKQEQLTILTHRDRDTFLNALDNPPAPTDKAIAAARKYREDKAAGRIR